MNCIFLSVRVSGPGLEIQTLGREEREKGTQTVLRGFRWKVPLSLDDHIPLVNEQSLVCSAPHLTHLRHSCKSFKVPFYPLWCWPTYSLLLYMHNSRRKSRQRLRCLVRLSQGRCLPQVLWLPDLPPPPTCVPSPALLRKMFNLCYNLNT